MRITAAAAAATTTNPFFTNIRGYVPALREKHRKADRSMPENVANLLRKLRGRGRTPAL